jgi:hypothetical protein
MTYTTQDIQLAAVLRLNNYSLASIDVKGNKGFFNFEEAPQDIVEQYDLGTILVEPQAFANTIKQLVKGVKRMTNATGYSTK